MCYAGSAAGLVAGDTVLIVAVLAGCTSALNCSHGRSAVSRYALIGCLRDGWMAILLEWLWSVYLIAAVALGGFNGIAGMAAHSSTGRLMPGGIAMTAILYIVIVLSELRCGPTDVSECESEIVGGLTVD